MAKKEELTPMMKQFYDFKAKHPDALLKPIMRMLLWQRRFWVSR